MVGGNKLSLFWLTITLCVFDEFAVSIIGLRGFWLKTISYGVSLNAIVV